MNRRACAEMLGIPLPQRHKLQRMHRSKRITTAKTPIEAGILVAEILEECEDGAILVVRTGKMLREAAPGEVHHDLSVGVHRTADTSHPGNCKTWWSDERFPALVYYVTNRHSRYASPGAGRLLFSSINWDHPCCRRSAKSGRSWPRRLNCHAGLWGWERGSSPQPLTNITMKDEAFASL